MPNARIASIASAAEMVPDDGPSLKSFAACSSKKERSRSMSGPPCNVCVPAEYTRLPWPSCQARNALLAWLNESDGCLTTLGIFATAGGRCDSTTTGPVVVERCGISASGDSGGVVGSGGSGAGWTTR